MLLERFKYQDLLLASFLWLLSTQAPAQVGKTSYTAPPFSSEVYQQSWGASPGLLPTQLFWESSTFFTNATNLSDAKGSAASMDSKGIVPHSGAQLWEDSYANSFPAGTFPNAPDNVDGGDSSLPENKAWVNWVKARQNLLDVQSDGGSAPDYFRSWGGSWGYISPLTPLDQADWPSGVTNATYGDWFARKWAQTSAKSGAYGILLSDFVDSQPHMSTQDHGFNSRIIAKFEAKIGMTIPGSTISAKASYINKNLLNAWTDFTADGYATFYASLVREIKAQTGREPLIIDQSALWPSLFRMRANDPKLILNRVSTNNIIFIWDTMTMSPEREGKSVVYSLGMAPLAAAREPRARIGANMHSDDDNYWAGINSHYSNLSATDRKERGLKELKRLWFEMVWAHIADQNGSVRRALAFTQRNYWDDGALDSAVANLVKTIVPRKPFGYGLYYSTRVEKTVETYLGTSGQDESKSYMNPDLVVDWKNNQRVPWGYFVSDSGLASLKAESAPAAWIILDRKHPGTGADMLPADELAALQKIAPVLSSPAEVAAFANKPISFSSGANGIAFYDQNNRVIFTTTNLNSSTNNVTVSFSRLPAGTHSIKDLISGESFSLNISSSGTGSVVLPVTRWDTRALAITLSSTAPSPSPSPTPSPTPSPSPSTAGTLVRSIEAESFTTKSTGQNQSGLWALMSNGYIENAISFPAAGYYDIEVVAKGSLLGGVGPAMDIKIDDSRVNGQDNMNTTLRTYRMRFYISSAGSHRVALAFTNDGSSSSEDRNLYIDKVSVYTVPSGTPTTALVRSIEAENFVTKTNGQNQSGLWALWSNGYIEDSVSFPAAGYYDVIVVAKGSLLGKVGANMELRLDGQAVSGQDSVYTTLLPYRLRIYVSSGGTHRIAIAFTNNATSSTEDRNLYLDRITIYKAP